MAKFRAMVISLRRFSELGKNGPLVLRIGRDGINENQESYLFGELADIQGVNDVETSWRYIRIEKDVNSDWLRILPAIRTVLLKMFGRKTRIIERTERIMPISIVLTLDDADRYRDDYYVSY